MRRFIFSTLATAALAWGQNAIENWAVPAGMNGSQTVGVLGTLNQAVSDRPFSATAVVHMAHTLEDGTHINQTTTTLMYRDAQGRRRNETDGVIEISDPVSRSGLTLRTNDEVAIKRTVEAYVVPGDRPVSQASDLASKIGATEAGRTKTNGKKKSAAAMQQNVAELGPQMVNGVLCYGRRITITIPTGAIGNDREIKSVNETWTSLDLHLLVKSIDSDPRFGTGTYDLTNIVQAAPSASLFRMDIPQGYTVRTEQPLTLH